MSQAAATPLPRGSARRPGLRRRQVAVLLEVVGAAVWCVIGFRLFIDPMRHFEVRLASELVRRLGATGISGALRDSFVVMSPDGRPLLADMTPSCSSLTSLLALSALAFFVLRERPQVLVGFLLATVFVLFANQFRLVGSLLAARYLNVRSLIWFHDWVGAALTFCYTLGGLLIMIASTMHMPERAEQDRAGRHTARRPDGWAQPGLGYRVELDGRPPAPRFRVVAFLHRHVLPRNISRALAARRERHRVDYRVGHLDPQRRAQTVRELAGRGLGVHTATLVAVATHDTDATVLDALAEAVAARQWEPVSDQQIAALRLWARAWLMRTPGRVPPDGQLIAVTGAGGPAGVAVIRALRSAGHRVLALDANPDAVGLRLADCAAVLPRATATGYGTALLRTVKTHRPDALICTVAEEYPALNRMARRLAEVGCATWLPPIEAAETCSDKAAFAATLHAAGVPHPLTATNRLDAVRVPGPWIVKPARGRGSRDVVYADNTSELHHAISTVPNAIVQARLSGREFTADTLTWRDGTLVTCVPRWRDETKAGISVRGTTFESTAVTRVVAAAIAAVGLTGPANVQGFVADPEALDRDPDADVAVTIVEINPRFSGGLPLTLAAGADVVGAYLGGILDPHATPPQLTFQPGVRMARYFTEVYYTADGAPLADPLTVGAQP